MANPQASLLSLTVQEQSTLSLLQNKHSCPQQLVRRIEIIQLAANGATNTAIAEELCITRNTVRLWRDRWIAGAAARAAVTDPRDISRLIAGQLTDVTRPGAPPTFTPQQQVHIVAIACEDPKKSDRTISHWSEREIADEAIKRNIVPSISQRQVGRFLKRGQLKTA
jgi:putative transposase